MHLFSQDTASEAAKTGDGEVRFHGETAGFEIPLRIPLSALYGISAIATGIKDLHWLSVSGFLRIVIQDTGFHEGSSTTSAMWFRVKGLGTT